MQPQYQKHILMLSFLLISFVPDAFSMKKHNQDYEEDSLKGTLKIGKGVKIKGDNIELEAKEIRLKGEINAKESINIKAETIIVGKKK